MHQAAFRDKKHTSLLIGLMTCLALSVGSAAVVEAHDLNYALATVSFRADASYEVLVSCHIAAYVLEAESGHLAFAAWALLRDMSDEELQYRAEYGRRSFTERLHIAFDGRAVSPELIEFPGIDRIREDGLSLEPKRAPPILIKGSIPAGAREFSLALPYQIGVVLLQAEDRTTSGSGQFVPAGKAGLPVPVNLGDRDPQPRTLLLSRYLLLGYTHILPKGLDHILFVLGLFLLTAKWKALLGQVTAFTVAHSLTLGLAVYGIVELPKTIVEPLIALSIAAVAVENLFTSRLHYWRPLIVFGFGLLHGLGFASILRAVQLAPGDIAVALAGFNIGVEMGQLNVILLALLAVGWFKSEAWYRLFISVPASCAIALTGLYWTVQRIFFAA